MSPYTAAKANYNFGHTPRAACSVSALAAAYKLGGRTSSSVTCVRIELGRCKRAISGPVDMTHS